MIILTKLLLAHLLGDFVLQPEIWVRAKEIRRVKSLQLYLHAAIHGGLVLLFLWNLQFWTLALTIAVLHLLFDLLKLHYQTPATETRWFLTDQLLHLISIAGVYYLWFKPPWNLKILLQSDGLWTLLTTLIVLGPVSAILIRILMKKWTSEIKTDNSDDSLNKAGTYIGVLERLFIFVFVVEGNLSAIGFLLAAKSVFRFGDLREAKNRKLTEYVLIGTLVSFGIAVAAGKTVLHLLQ